MDHQYVDLLGVFLVSSCLGGERGKTLNGYPGQTAEIAETAEEVKEDMRTGGLRVEAA